MKVSPDRFATAAAKLRWLLDLRPSDPVRIAGNHFAAQRGDFEQAFSSVTVGEARGEYQPKLLSALDARDAGAASIEDRLASARRDLAPDGVMLVVAPGSMRSWSTGQHKVRRALASCGLRVTHAFLPFPTLSRVDEFWNVRTRSGKLPSSAGFLRQTLHRLGLAIHSDRDVLLVAGASLQDRLTRRLDSLRPLLGLPESSAAVLDRFALRPRGATILLISSAIGGRVVRAATDAVVASKLERNHLITARLHALPRLPERWSRLIPRPIGRSRVGGAECLVEQLMPGTLAWKLEPGGAAAGRAAAEADEFAAALGIATGITARLSEEDFAVLIGSVVDRLIAAPEFAGDPPSVETLARLRQELRSRLLGQSVTRVLGHGDFGFGNLLVDPRTGALQGVIDWDTAIDAEFEGVDTAHLRIQRETLWTGGDFARAFERAIAGAPADRTPYVIAALRIISRSVDYRDELARLSGAYRRLLRAVGGSLDAHRLPDA